MQSNLERYGFNKDRIRLECERMVVYSECDLYALTLFTYDESLSDSDFRYDDAEDKDNLLQAIKDIKTLDLPIKNLNIDNMYTPDQVEDQYFTEIELDEREETAYFGKRAVSISNLDDIVVAEDIHLDY